MFFVTTNQKHTARILIYDSQMKDNMIYKRLNGKVIVLRYLNNDYNIVEDLGKYLFSRHVNFCRKCMKCISNALNHVCLTENIGIKCYGDCNVDNSTMSNSTKCPLYDIYFFDQTCLSQHYSKKHPVVWGNTLSTCQLFKYCFECNSIVKWFHYINSKGKKRFNCCQKYTVPLAKNPDRDVTIVTFQFQMTTTFLKTTKTWNEKSTYTILKPKLMKNKKEYWFFITLSFTNFDNLKTSVMKCCGERCFRFSGDNTLKQYTNFFIQRSKQNFKSRWFTHNAGKFNCLFLLKRLVCKCNLNPKCLSNRNKITIWLGNCQALDSLLFFRRSLEKTIGMLGLQNKVSKGFHPYKFTDIDYVGDMISKNFFNTKYKWLSTRKVGMLVFWKKKNCSNIVLMMLMFWENVFWILTTESKTSPVSNSFLTITSPRYLPYCLAYFWKCLEKTTFYQ